MRLKKQKRHRKSVRFYKACFGFREPFKVLCDGNFVHHLVVNRITPADTALSNILGATVKIFTTRCVLAELKTLGHSYSHSLQAAQNLLLARCDHDKRKSAVACLTDVIGENNTDHFFVATQDANLRKNFQEEIPGVPVIFGLRNALFLEPPSTFQHQFVKSAEEQRSRMTELEYKMFEMKTKTNRLATEDAPDANEIHGDQNLTPAVLKTETARNKIVKDTPQFKRKKAKGPNPLSCKKKKSHMNPSLILKKESKDGETVRTRSRKRKRSRTASVAEATG